MKMAHQRTPEEWGAELNELRGIRKDVEAALERLKGLGPCDRHLVTSRVMLESGVLWFKEWERDLGGKIMASKQHDYDKDDE